MSQNDHQNREEQEVDLVPVFVWISNGIKNFFKGIAAFFKGIGHAIILFLVFLQRNIILIGVFVLIGLGLGFYLDSHVNKVYTAQLRVMPNFKSNAQLISNINFYNALAIEEDYERLSNELEISLIEAKEIKSLNIEPSFNDTELLEEYDLLARSSDTMALENFTFEGFKQAKREIDYEFYEIIAKSESRSVLEKALPKILNVKDNSGITAAKLASKETVEFNIQSSKYQLQELDSLIYSYQSMIRSTQNSTGNTNLFVGDQKSSDILLNLFSQKQTLLKELETLREEKYAEANTVNIISNYVIKGSVKKKHIKLKVLILSFLLGIFIAFIPSVWKFLKTYPTQTN